MQLLLVVLLSSLLMVECPQTRGYAQAVRCYRIMRACALTYDYRQTEIICARLVVTSN